MVALVVIVTVLFGIHGVAAEDDCVRIIRECDEDEYEELAAEPMKNPGFYGYMLPCGGIVTSVEARGFCGRPDNVELLLISGGRANHSFEGVTRRELLPAKCNKTAMVDNSYEGYVNATGLNFTVPRSGMLVMHLNLECSISAAKCYFQPAVINETSNYDVVFGDSHLEWSRPNMSLFFSVNITELSELPDENKKESENSDVLYVIIGVLCFLLLCATLSILIALSIKRCGSIISATGEIPTSTNEAYWKVERKKGNELLTISNGEPPPRSRPLPTIPFPLYGATEEEDCATAVYEVIPGDH